jgi:hypothetical protein
MDINFRSRGVATIRFKADGQITAKRGFDAVTLNLPFEVAIEAEPSGSTWQADGITAELYGTASGGRETLLATGTMPTALESRVTAFSLEHPAILRCSPKAIAEYEGFRAGGATEMRIKFFLNVHSLIPGPDHRRMLCQTQTVWAQETFLIDKVKWITALKATGLSASVLVEIPFPLVSNPGDDGLIALNDAAASFGSGGSVAWKDSVGHIRPYLETWKKTEPLPATDPKDGSAADRRWKLLNCRDALYKCCHFWVHESASATTREDALFALSTFAALLKAYRA